jgi:hypothetical protein
MKNPFKKAEKKEVVITPEVVVVKKDARRTGRTTRLIDKYIQELFKKRSVQVVDHNDTNNDDNHTLKILLRRLKTEHGIDSGSLFIEGNTIKFNR